jgi:hypothetical protein
MSPPRLDTLEEAFYPGKQEIITAVKELKKKKRQVMEKEAKIYVAGGQSLIGAAILGELESQGYGHLLGKYSEGLDLTDPSQVDAYFATTKPEYVFLAAGKSGGIEANQKYPADLMRDNLLTECHILHSAFQHRVKKLLYLASSCSYPKHCPQPMKEEYLLTGLLESTNGPMPWPRSRGSLSRLTAGSTGPFLCGSGNASDVDDFSEDSP